MSKPEDFIREVRKAIDEADSIFLKALASRFRAIRHLRTVKNASGIPAEDLEREKALKELWKKQAVALDIPIELALLMLDCIFVESKKIQDHSL